MSEEVKGIYDKIHNIMEDVQYMAKDATIAYKDVNYRGLSEEKVTTAMRTALVKYGVIVFPIEQSHHRDGTLTTVDVKYRFVDIEDGSYIDVVSSGTGSDTQDKGVGKAMTYAFKYMWLRTFALPTGEDPDKISSAELDDKQKATAVDEGKRAVLQLLEDNPDLSQDFVASTRMDVDEAVEKEDVDTLRIIYKEIKDEIRKSRPPKKTKAELAEGFKNGQ